MVGCRMLLAYSRWLMATVAGSGGKRSLYNIYRMYDKRNEDIVQIHSIYTEISVYSIGLYFM